MHTLDNSTACSLLMLAVACIAFLLITSVILARKVLTQYKEIESLKNWWSSLSNDQSANIDVYQDKANATNLYQKGFENRVCCSLGLSSEAGEVAGKVDKCIRKNHNTEFTEDEKRDIAYEIGDVMWYAAGLARDLGYHLSEILNMNIEKLASRNKRGKLCGSGDHR